VAALHHITDGGDARCAPYRNLPDADLAARHGRFVAEGRLVVRRLLSQSSLAVESLMVTAPALTAIEDLLAARSDLPVYVVPQAIMNGITGFNIHRGCLAIGLRPPARSWSALTAAARRLLVLERIANADNVGACFRNAAAFGMDAVLLDGRSTDPLYRKAIRTSMGAALAIPFARADSIADAVRALDASGWTVLALTPGGRTPLCAIAVEAADRVALVVGHEGEGLSPATLEACRQHVRIPMAQGVDSLNVATAAAVGMYEVGRQESGRRT
jgi:tRNA G18 (ribose-2'-O)-methylase SpoU